MDERMVTGFGPATCNNASRVVVSSAVQDKLVEFASVLGKRLGVELPVRDFVGCPASDLKRYTSAMLEGKKHEWTPVLRRLCAQDRLTAAGSLFSFRKVLPSPEADTDAYVTRMCSPQDPADPGYLRFVRKSIKREFPVGWDQGWWECVQTTTPSTSSCLGVTRSAGGARKDLVGSREWFLTACGVGDPGLNLSTLREVGVAEKDGKARVVTTSPSEAVVLEPLHRLIYGWIRKRRWVLDGEADPEKFEGFERKRGEVFVSGDYESATDNLKLDVAQAILETILTQCRFVPTSIRDAARQSLQCVLVGKNRIGLQMRGQLMGNYLSFPLLCLQNHLAFRYLVPRRGVPVKINGDDIVFRATRAEYKVWAEGLARLGLTLSKGKTFVHHRFFSLNSTFFRARPQNSVVGVPQVRASLFFKGVESADSIGGRFAAVAKFWAPKEASDLKVDLLIKLGKAIRTTQRSVTRGLGAPVTIGELVRAGFEDWERFYLGFPSESRPPSKMMVSGAIPPGWVKWRPRIGDAQDDVEFLPELVAHTWTVPCQKVSTNDYWAAVRVGTVKYAPRRAAYYTRSACLLQVTAGAARRYLNPRLPEAAKVCGKSVWRRRIV